MNEKKLSILKHLRSNARKSFINISERIGMPLTTVFDNYKKFRNKEIITKHTSLLDFKKLGFYFRSFVFVKTKDKEEMLCYLKDHGNVNSVFKINNYDYLVDAVFPSIKEYYYFLEHIQDFNIQKLETHNVIEHLKREEFFSMH